MLNESNNSSAKIEFSGTFDPSTNELNVTNFSGTMNSGVAVGIRASGTLNLDNDLIYGNVEIKNPEEDAILSLPINVQYEPN